MVLSGGELGRGTPCPGPIQADPVQVLSGLGSTPPPGLDWTRGTPSTAGGLSCDSHLCPRMEWCVNKRQLKDSMSSIANFVCL